MPVSNWQRRLATVVFLLHLKPFYVGTYFPKEGRYGMPGFGEVLKQLDEAFHFRKNEIYTTTSELMNSLIASSKNNGLINKDLEIDKSNL